MQIKLNSAQEADVLSYTAEELKKYVNMLPAGITATSFTVCLSVEESLEEYGLPVLEDTRLDDQFVYEISKDGGWVKGVNGRSVLLGVYRYLYEIGFRFLRPGSLYESVPNDVKPADLEQKLCHAYPFRHRGVCLEGACSVENILDFIEWMPKVGFNSFFVQFQEPVTFLERWYRHENNPFLEAEEFNEDVVIKHSLRINAALRQRGLIHHRVGHGWTCETAGYPSGGWKQWEDHRQSPLLAMVNGQRKLYYGIPLNTNLCYSSPDVVEVFSDKVVSYAALHQDVDYLHVWLADDHNNICECEECKKSLPSDQYIHILNVIDKKLTKLGLDTHIVFLIYQELLWPPQTQALDHAQRFTLMFAPISRRFMISFPESLPEMEIPGYERNHIVMPADVDENLAYLKEWQKVFAGDSFDYDYPLGRAHYGDFGYMGISEIIFKDIDKLKKLGLNGYMSCQQLRTCFPNALPDYIMGMKLSGIEQSFKEMAEDYFYHAYGQGFRDVMGYLAELSKLSDWDFFNGKGDRISEAVKQKMEAIVEKTESFCSVIGSAQTKGRLQQEFYEALDYHREYCRRLAKAVSFLSGNETEKAAKAWEEWKIYIGGKEERYQSCLDVYRVIEVSGKFTGFKNLLEKNKLGDCDDISK